MRNRALDPDLVSSFIARFGGMETTSRCVQEDRRFTDELSAVRAAMDYFSPLSLVAGVAFNGVVYRIEDQFAFRGSVMCSGSQGVHLSPAIAQNSIVAFWRTAGTSAARDRYFSGMETSFVNQYAKPFYLSNYAGLLKVFSPGDGMLSKEVAQRLVGVPQEGYALGRLVQDEFGHNVKINTRIQDHHFSMLDEF